MMEQSPILMAPPQPATPSVTSYRPSLAARRWIWVGYAIAWTTALLMPVPLPEQTDPRWQEPLFTFTKCVHVSAYAVFTGLSAWLLLPRRYRWIMPIVLVGHGMLTELLQHLMHDICGRTGQWSDVGLDVIGIAIGVALSWKWWFAREQILTPVAHAPGSPAGE